MRILFLILGVLLFSLVPSVYAEVKHIGLELSESCQRLENEACGSDQLLSELYPETKLKPYLQKLLDDSSELSKVQNKPEQFLSKQKLDCIKRNYCESFNIKPNQKMMYWLNPDYTARQFLDSIITITPNMLNKNLNVTTNPIVEGENSRRITFEIHNLYVSSNCYEAMLKPETLWKELGFVIHYMAKNCQDAKLLGIFNKIYSEPLDKHDLDISTSPNFQAQQKLKEDMEKCKTKC